jgi:cytochrome bd ubiquinol oxidase subunit I
MDFDPVLLARLQFAFTIIFHIIFPSFTIGLSAYLATLGVMWLRSGNDRYQHLMRFWTKIFAVSFAMGVVSGIVLSYQFGTNWSRFSVATGNVLGPLLGYEVLAAFFLEATFLGILLFGFNRVPSWLYVLSAAVVATGTAISAFWILAANSWMQTPTGHEIRDGIAYPVDWLKVIFNPSFPYRFAHMLNAAYLTTGFVVLAVGARYLTAGRHIEEGRTMLRMAIGLTAILAPLQLVLGDQHGLNTLEHQPIKVAAMEAHWDGGKPGDFHIFAWPDEVAGVNHFELSIPKAASLILTHRMNGLFPGLNSVPASDRPPVKIVFFAFRIMLAVGSFMIAAARDGAQLVGWLRWSDRWLDRHRVRTSTLDRARDHAHGGRDISGPGRDHCGHAGSFRPGIWRRVLVRHLLHQPADCAGTAADRGRDGIFFTEPDFSCAGRRPQSNATVMGVKPWNGISR